MAWRPVTNWDDFVCGLLVGITVALLAAYMAWYLAARTLAAALGEG